MTTVETSASVHAISPDLFRRVMGRFATGVTVLSVEVGGEPHCMTANAFMSVSLDPPLALVSLGNQTRMLKVLSAGQALGVSFLSGKQETECLHYGGRSQKGYYPALSFVDGCALLDGAVAHLSTSVEEFVPAGDHTLVLLRICKVSLSDGDPLVFYGGRLSAYSPAPQAEPWARPEVLVWG